jgi:Cell differentiation family, Rcd1-like
VYGRIKFYFLEFPIEWATIFCGHIKVNGSDNIFSLFFSCSPLYLYPFLNTQSKSRPFEYLRLTSLGVIGALVKVDDTEVISFLLSTEIIPLCLRIMETGSELSKTVATFIVQKVLLEDGTYEFEFTCKIIWIRR